MFNSINTNVGAMVALKNLNTVNANLDRTQNRVSTGERVASAVDDGGAFAVAQGLRGDVKALDAVNSQLSIGIGAVGVALEGATSLSNTYNDLKANLVKLADDSISAAQRTQYEADFDAIIAEAENFIANSQYNGNSLLTAATTALTGGVNGSALAVIATTTGVAYTIAQQDLETTLAALTAAKPANAAASSALLDGTNTAFNAAVTATDNALNQLGADSRRLENQITFNTAVRDATESGLGAIVDADLARESAKLQAYQTQQQLSIQALGIANQRPQSLLGLFG